MNSAANVSCILSATATLHVQINGRSMEPTVRHGQQITVRRPSKLIVGNCYLFNYQDTLQLHRLITRTKKTAYFMGDNSNCIERIATDAILAEPVVQPRTPYRMVLVLCNQLYLTITHYCHCKSSILYKIRRKLIMTLCRYHQSVYHVVNKPMQPGA